MHFFLLDYLCVCFEDIYNELLQRIWQVSLGLAQQKPTVHSSWMMPICGTDCQLRWKIDFLEETHPLATLQLVLQLVPSVNHWFGSSLRRRLKFQSTNVAAMPKQSKVTATVCFIYTFCQMKTLFGICFLKLTQYEGQILESIQEVCIFSWGTKFRSSAADWQGNAGGVVSGRSLLVNRRQQQATSTVAAVGYWRSLLACLFVLTVNSTIRIGNLVSCFCISRGRQKRSRRQLSVCLKCTICLCVSVQVCNRFWVHSGRLSD